ncbi:beta-lactamase family protein [Massilia sp. IC2-477]|uniref:serine hydrolase domain-containing protein n=1 Tax=Massilia sp. IC2-477 TaxID=2887198 RepID=UPI001D120731|nr:serine hydrolase domain-containing protein [Massilia sp. IC2-477]MCC2956313.1 beta-lactamase family protein [Massilia sp. IC2-477]
MKRPHFLLALLLCLPLAAPAALAEPAALAQSLDRIIAARFKPELPGVAALVVKDGRPILRKAYGMANLELGVLARPEHVYRIGSTTKLFTATAIMLLVDDGRIALDAPVKRYLPDAPPQWDKVTIEHLLTHTSGIPNLSMDSGYWRTTARLEHTPAELVDPVRTRPLENPPGTSFAYNNTGYNLLGLVIEQVSGEGYYAFLERRIFKPLGLAHTREGSDSQVIAGLVTGYRSGPAAAWPLASSNFYAAGGLVSTVDDLAAFMLALQAGKLVSPAGVKRMNTSYVLPNGKATDYGFGTWLRTVNGKRLVGHGGYVFNFYSQLEMDVDSGIVAVTLHNGDRFGGDNEVLSKQLISEVQTWKAD